MPSDTLLPNHVVIIPDGNRRWAKERGLDPWKGHEAGAENTELLVREARRLGVREISFWGSSLENLTKRPVAESRALLSIYEKYFAKLAESEDIHADQARIRFIGHWEEQFPDSLKRVMYRCIEATKQYDQHFLNFFLAYSGDDEMRIAFERASHEIQSGVQVTDELIKKHLMTKDLPPVDYLIRTGGEPHLSAGFMMWDIANAQLFFSEKLYPDFGPEAFQAAIEEYGERSRRFGS
ncbi:MAG: di-trans,poly-cis-decaprenylcistransferase [Candidatus Moranbacteria bacterium]|nr:di-trans,poly-cis-decaprenylcistransferase [Candidatus Moranbacteria bacterium]